MSSIRWITLGFSLFLGIGFGAGGPAEPASAQSPCDIAYACGDAVPASCDPGFPSEACIAPPGAPVVPPPPPVEIDFCVWNAAACGDAVPAEP